MLCGKAAATMPSTLLLVGTSCRPRQQHMLKALLRTTAVAVAQSGSSSSSSHQCQKQQSLPLAQHQQQQHSPPPFPQQQQRRHFSIGSVFVGAAEQRAKTEAELAANKEQIESLIQKHQVSSVSLPVRAEFVRDSPLSTKDLESIDIHVYHRRPVTLSDHVAYRSVKLLRFFADAFFRQRYVHRAIVLETVAGVPGMVAGMLCHMRSLRRMQHDNGWIEKLLHEAENERMHLMIWMKVTEPTVLERMLVTFVQGLFFNAYMLYYLVFPRTAHRFVGYLEEEAIVSYNAFAKEVLCGNIENTPAPQVAIDYYNLDKEARLLDVVYAVRADEAAHRDANHNFADRIDDRKENLSTAAATAGEEELTQKQPQ